jgi:hypothetical protein
MLLQQNCQETVGFKLETPMGFNGKMIDWILYDFMDFRGFFMETSQDLWLVAGGFSAHP